jgi:HK97 family phage major capsid protein
MKYEELREQALAKFMEAKALADADGGTPSAEHMGAFDALWAEATEIDKQANAAKGTADKVETVSERIQFYAGRMAGREVPFRTVALDRRPGMTMGQSFVASQEYADLVKSGALQSNDRAFRSSQFVAAAGDVINSTTGQPGAGLVTPDYRAGVIALPQRPLTVRALFSQDTTTSDTISYAQQTGFDSAAAAVAQATSLVSGAKPQSSIAWTRKTAVVETIGTWMAATRQQLADAGQTRSLIDNQLGLMLDLETEDQLLNGDGQSPNLIGLLDNQMTGLQLLDVSAAATDHPNIDAIRIAKKMVRTGLSRATADGVLMTPTDSAEYDLTEDGNKNYMAGNPFGGGAGDGASPIWRLPRIETEALTDGTAIVGAYKVGGTVLERAGVTIIAADQHSDFAIRGLVAIIGETRLGFPVYFPSAFVKVTLHAW